MLLYVIIIYFLNFDKDHYKIFIVFNVLSIPFSAFFSNETKFSMVIENAIGYSYTCKSITRWSYGCLLVGKCKMLHLRNSMQKFKFKKGV